jgi:transcriptional regulator with XRE-family HTH domain
MIDFSENNSIASRIEKMRESENLNKKQFAELLSINEKTFGTYTRGASPSVDFLLAAHRHGFNLDWLIAGDGEMYRANREAVRQDVVSYARESNVVTTGVNNGNIVAEVGIQQYNTDAGGRGQRLCDWVREYAAAHSDADVGHLVERMRRAFPEFEDWDRK